MHLPKRAISILSLIIFCISAAFAAEGMWLLDQLEQLDWQSLQQQGLQMKPDDIRQLQEAVVIIDGGTGAFVSSTGLVLTNHHVAYGAIQRASSVDQNYLKEGFLAQSPAEEIPIPGYNVQITKYYKEVTEEVLSAVTGEMSPGERFRAIERRKKELVDEVEAESGFEAEVVEMYSGMKYYLFTYEKFEDVRLVYAPPGSIGEFGGDIDNWMWPRHTGDFSLFRVYANREGKPAEYSEDNVPFHPGKHLTFAKSGLKEGDMTFALGYPGATYRYRTSYSIAYHQNVNYPTQIELFQTMLDIIKGISDQDPEAALKLASLEAALNNVVKNNEGMLHGFKKLHLLEKKKEMEREFQNHVNSNPELKAKYGALLSEIGKLYQDLDSFAAKRDRLNSMFFVRLPYTIYAAYRYALEKEKPEQERDPAYSDKAMKQTVESVKIRSQEYVPAFDREMLKATLLRFEELPEDQRVAFFDRRFASKSGDDLAAAVNAYIRELFSATQFKTLSDALPLFEKSLAEIKGMDDPLIDLMMAYAEEVMPLDTKYDEFSGAIVQLRSDYMRALFEWKGETLYPDANRTLRFTYGEVAGYSPADAIRYLPKTTLSGVIEKHTGEEPFDAPEKLIELHRQKDYGGYMDLELQDVPVDFLHVLDSTGGNSGSPVLNGKGELVGVLFDGNYEAMTADYQFDPEITRSISVDARYILFVLDKYAGAKHLLQEMHIAL